MVAETDCGVCCSRAAEVRWDSESLWDGEWHCRRPAKQDGAVTFTLWWSLTAAWWRLCSLNNVELYPTRSCEEAIKLKEEHWNKWRNLTKSKTWMLAQVLHVVRWVERCGSVDLHDMVQHVTRGHLWFDLFFAFLSRIVTSGWSAFV